MVFEDCRRRAAIVILSRVYLGDKDVDDESDDDERERERERERGWQEVVRLQKAIGQRND